jgi:hypothetical protein
MARNWLVILLWRNIWLAFGLRGDSMSTTLNELLPCPFCGLQPDLIQAHNDAAWWIVSCPHQDCEVGPTIEREGKGVAVAAWNKRPVARLTSLLPGDVVTLQRIWTPGDTIPAGWQLMRVPEPPALRRGADQS